MHRPVLIFLAAMALAACAPNLRVTSSRTASGQYESKPPDCELRFEDLAYTEAVAKYYEIGQVWLTGPDAVAELTETQKDLVRPEACRMGGEIVTLGSSVSDNVIFLVLRDSK
jgi:hypothetical protein